MYLYDEIGGWGVTAGSFTQAIDALDVDVIDLRINSPGGSVFDGMAIMNALRRHSARVEITVDGLAASAASFIATAGDHVVMNSGSEMMIHDAWGFAQGDAKTMREMAISLEKTSAAIAGLYAKRAGGKAEEWRELMLAETWYTAEEAVAAGLADEWADAPAAENKFDLSKYGYRGRLPAVAGPAVNRSPVTGPANTEEESDMALREDLIEHLGLEAEATDEEILEAVDAAVDAADDAEGDDDGDSGDGDGGGAGSARAPRLPSNMVAVDKGALETLQRNAKAGAEALARMDKQRREDIVNAAVRDGRIAPASRATWLSMLENDEANATSLIGDLPKNTIPVDPIGKTDGIESEEDALLAKWGVKSEGSSK